MQQCQSNIHDGIYESVHVTVTDVSTSHSIVLVAASTSSPPHCNNKQKNRKKVTLIHCGTISLTAVCASHAHNQNIKRDSARQRPPRPQQPTRLEYVCPTDLPRIQPTCIIPCIPCDFITCHHDVVAQRINKRVSRIRAEIQLPSILRVTKGSSPYQ